MLIRVRIFFRWMKDLPELGRLWNLFSQGTLNVIHENDSWCVKLHFWFLSCQQPVVMLNLDLLSRAPCQRILCCYDQKVEYKTDKDESIKRIAKLYFLHCIQSFEWSNFLKIILTDLIIKNKKKSHTIHKTIIMQKGKHIYIKEICPCVGEIRCRQPRCCHDTWLINTDELSQHITITCFCKSHRGSWRNLQFM